MVNTSCRTLGERERSTGLGDKTTGHSRYACLISSVDAFTGTPSRSPRPSHASHVKRSSAMFERRTMHSDAEDEIVQ